MSHGILVLSRIHIQSANAIAGSTWGFPAISAFLGFSHALDRLLRKSNLQTQPLFSGCGIVCHYHQLLTTSHYDVHQFNQLRAPLTKKGKTAPFNEEGRMHMTATLMIEVSDGIDVLLDALSSSELGEKDEGEWLCDQVLRLASGMRLAGGTILKIGSVEYHRKAGVDGDVALNRRLLSKCLPGFALIDRSELLTAHLKARRLQEPNCDVVDAWMDFTAIRHRSMQTPIVTDTASGNDKTGEDDKDGEPEFEWQRVLPPEIGWFVPLMVGFQGISSLICPDSDSDVRDPDVPFRWVESIYGIGQWLSPHRCTDIGRLFWRYASSETGNYLFKNGDSNS